MGGNIDLIDRFWTVVASDQFRGVTDGQAFSQPSVAGLPVGEYDLRFTATGLGGSRYHFDLTTDATAPSFTPIDDGVTVPEASSVAVLLSGMVMLLALRAGVAWPCGGARG